MLNYKYLMIMKKISIVLAMVLLCTCGYSQKKMVASAKNKAMNTEAPDFAGAREDIKQALENPETKDLANTWYVAGLIGYKENEYAMVQTQLGRQKDDEKVGSAVVESYNYWLRADEIAMTPVLDKKGREIVDLKTRKQISDKMFEYYRSQDLVKYGIYLNEKRDYSKAYDVFMMHLAMPDMPMMQNEKYQKEMQKDTIYMQYKYYAGIFATQSERHQEAISIYESMKDGDFEAISVNQFLYQEYVALKDTANFVRVLQEAVGKYPQEPWFLQNLINYYIFSGQEQMAINYLNEAIEREPNVAQYHHIKGNLDENAKNYEAALADFDAAIAIDPNLADAYAGKGRVYYNRAVKMDEDAAYISDNKAYKAALVARDEMYRKSLPFFEKAHDLDKKNRDYMIVLKGLYYRFGMMDKNAAIIEEMNN